MLLDKFVNKNQPNEQSEQKKIEIKPETVNISSKVENVIKNLQLGAKSSEQQTSKDPSKNPKNTFIDKIKAIKTIKGYELKNNQLIYDV